MTRFKLKSGVTFTPEGARYLVLDNETQSRFRVGEMEYLLLKQFEETTDVEDVRYLLSTEYGYDIPYDTLSQFIRRAINLNILQAQSRSLWHRLTPASPITWKLRLFDPGRLLDALLSGGRLFFGRWALAASLLLMLAALVLVVANWPHLWVFRSLRLPPFYATGVAVVLLLSVGHELAHGLAGRRAGFEVTEVGFHLHYFLPSFYCKIFHSGGAARRSMMMVLLAGSLWDLVAMSLLVLLWRFGPASAALQSFLGVTISLLLIKVFLLQLNPLWPFSDGYRVLGLFLRKKEWR